MALISPIFNRELLGFLRSQRSFGGLFLYLVVLSITVGICWWATQATGWATERDLLSRRLFMAVMLAQLIIFSGYALILTATKINSEKEEGTFDLLVTTRLSILHILLAKYLSALVAILLLVFASIPIMSLCFLLGGVDRQEMSIGYAILLATVMTYGMVGIACSSICRKNHVALIVAFMVALFFYFVGGFARQVVPFAYDRSVGMFLEVTSPLGAFAEAILKTKAKMSKSTILTSHAAFDFYLFTVSLLVAWYGFRHMAGQPTRAMQRDEWRKAFSDETGERRPWFFSRSDSSLHPVPFDDAGNPVTEHEDRLLAAIRRKIRPVHYLFAAFPLLAIAGVLGRISETYPLSATSYVGLATSVLAAVLVTLLAATVVTREYEADTLPMLSGTLLTPLEILGGKFRALFLHAFWTALVFSFVVFIIVKGWSPAALIAGVFRAVFGCLAIAAPLFAIMLFYASVGLFFSVMCRKSVSAIALSYATLAGLAAVPWIIATVYWIASRTVLGRSYDFKGLSFLAPITSPCLYFLPSEELNFWHVNSGFGHMMGFCLLIVGFSIAILVAAKAKFELMLYQPTPQVEE